MMNRNPLSKVALFAPLLFVAACGAQVFNNGKLVSPRALADSIDPGPVAPLFEQMSLALGERWRPTATGDIDVLRARVLTAVQGLEKGSVDSGSLGTLVSHLAAAEPTRSKTSCDRRCLLAWASIYQLLDVPSLLERESFFGSLFALCQSMLREHKAVSQLTREVKKVITGAATRHRRVAAMLLRRAPRSREAAEVLIQLAGREARQERFSRAAALHRAALERPGPQGAARAQRHLDLAVACYQALRPGCGDSALNRARKAYGPELTGENKKALAGAVKSRGLARKLQQGRGGRDLTSRLVRAETLLELGRTRQAERAYNELRREAPRDARPHVGLALVALSRFQLNRSHQWIKRARDLDHRDRTYHEMAVGLMFAPLMNTLLQPELYKDPDKLPDKLRARILPMVAAMGRDLRGLRPFLPERTETLEVLNRIFAAAIRVLNKRGDVTWRELEPICRRALSRVRSIRARHPGEPDARRLELFLTLMLNDQRSCAVADRRDPGEDEDLLRLRASTLLRHAARYGDAAVLPGLRALAASSPRTCMDRDKPPPPGGCGKKIRQELAVVADALQARFTQNKEAWARAARGYRGLLSRVQGDEDRARLLNNLGVAQFEQGKTREALKSWGESGQLSTNGISRLNELVARPGPSSDRDMADLAAQEGNAGHQALAWSLHHTGLFEDEVSQALARSRTRLAGELLPTSTGDHGLLETGAFLISLGYSTVSGLVSTWKITPKPWLLIPAPAPGSKATRASRPARPAPDESAPKRQRIAAIHITGNRQVRIQAIRHKLRISVGARLEKKQIQDSIRAIYRLGVFENVAVETRTTPVGHHVTFRISESPPIRRINITGGAMPRAAALKILGLRPSRNPAPMRHERCARLKTHLRQQGYCDAEVTCSESRRGAGLELTVAIEQGIRTTVGRFRLTGLPRLDRKTRRAVLAILGNLRGTPLCGGVGSLDLDRAPALLSAYYYDRGFINMSWKAGAGKQGADPTMTRTDHHRAVITLAGTEGARYRLGTIGFSAHDKLRRSSLPAAGAKRSATYLGLMGLTPGTVFNRSRLADAMKVLKKHLERRHRRSLLIHPITNILPDKRTVSLVFNIEPGA